MLKRHYDILKIINIKRNIKRGRTRRNNIVINNEELQLFNMYIYKVIFTFTLPDKKLFYSSEN